MSVSVSVSASERTGAPGLESQPAKIEDEDGRNSELADGAQLVHSRRK